MVKNKIAQHWVAPSKRDGCHNCKRVLIHFANPDSMYERKEFNCAQGEFQTKKMASCDLWEKK